MAFWRWFSPDFGSIGSNEALARAAADRRGPRVHDETRPMLTVRRLSKQFMRHGKPHVLFRDLSFDLPMGGRIALMGRNGQGKSTLLKILGGVTWPTSGTVTWRMRNSWPLGFGGGFQGGMTGIDNIRFLCRLYKKPAEEMIERVEGFACLGDALTIPVRYYSSGMRARLAFGLSLAIEFDCYLIDEVIAVGDAQFTAKCEEELFGRRADRAFIVATHDLAFLKRTCNSAIVIDSGRAKVFESVDVAADVYAALCDEESARRAAAYA
jgi:capsular polysaccharide transport system ATP-binding protein